MKHLMVGKALVRYQKQLFVAKDEVVDWTQQLPMRVGPLDVGRKVWLQSREKPGRILPHYSPAVGVLFRHVAAQRLDEELMLKRRQDLYYPKGSVLSPTRKSFYRHT